MAERKIRAGYYRRYDGKLIYLVTAAEDADGHPALLFFF